MLVSKTIGVLTLLSCDLPVMSSRTEVPKFHEGSSMRSGANDIQRSENRAMLFLF